MSIFKKFSSKFKNRNKSDRGVALISVMGITAVIAIIAGAVTAATALSSNVISAKLDSQQAQNASESGIIDAAQRLSAGECINRFESSGEPDYTFNVYRSTSNTLEGANWMYGCPIISDRWVKVESIGKWARNGYESIAVYDTQEAIYQVNPIDQSLVPYAMVISSPQLLTGFTIDQAQGVSGSLPTIVSNGVMDCPGTTTNRVPLNANVIINNIATTTSQLAIECTINGNLNAIFNTTTGTYNVGSAHVFGDVCTNKNFAASGHTYVKGKRTANDPNCLTASGYGYRPQNTYTTNLTSAQCSNFTTYKNFIESLDPNERHIIDMSSLRCTATQTNALFSSKSLKINSNITVIVNPATAISNFTVTSERPVSFNIAVRSSSASPTESSCSSPSSRMVLTNFKNEGGTRSMIYTPCALRLVNSSVVGQLYSGLAFTTSGNVSFTYAPSGLPYGDQKIVHNVGETFIRIK